MSERTQNAEPRKQSPAPTDPRVGQNPTGRPRRSSAPSRRKHARRQGGAS
ncbi:hypothetical protein [Streptomyces violaceus]|uniref:Uncharacterized protein n=1 Tax=Streptomyces violaceus TaxID=1936 RepID=A0ABZ1NL07_STRVL